MYKFGISIPKSVDKAYKIDKENGHDLWTKAIYKEMTDVKVVFKPLKDGENITIGHDFICSHIIFDLDMEEFSGHIALLLVAT